MFKQMSLPMFSTTCINKNHLEYKKIKETKTSYDTMCYLSQKGQLELHLKKGEQDCGI